MANPTSSAPNGYKPSQINPSTFLGNCEKQFADAPKWNKASEPDVLFVLRKLVADPRIDDLRYVAYTLATIFIETSHRAGSKREMLWGQGRCDLVCAGRQRSYERGRRA